jgi:hypothetical protein
MSDAKASNYWSGMALGRVEADQVEAAWGHGDNCGPRLYVLNRAFQVFAGVRRNIMKCLDEDQSREMSRELEDAAATGWGLGVQDLVDAFDHLLDNKVYEGGKWTDNKTDNFSCALGTSCIQAGSREVDPFGDPSSVIVQGYTPDAPAAGAHFLMAVDKKMKVLSGVASDHVTLAGQANEAKQKNDWKEYMDLLKKIEKNGKKALKFLWWAPRVKDAGNTFVSGVSILNKIADHADKVQDSRNTFPDMPLSAAIGIEVAATAAEGLPLLGKLYAEMFRGMPGLFKAMKELFEKHYHDLDMMVQDATYH